MRFNFAWLQKKLPWMLILFLAGVLLILVPEYTSNTKKETASPEADTLLYAEKLEERLCAMIGQIKGVSDVHVMVQLAGSEGVIRARSSDDAAGASALFASSLTSEEKDAKVVLAPKIMGVSVVCRGASCAVTRKKIADLIGSTLDLSQNKIFVTE